MDCAWNYIGESTTKFFLITLDFIFTPFIELKIFEKAILCLGKNFLDSRQRPISNVSHIAEDSQI